MHMLKQSIFALLLSLILSTPVMAQLAFHQGIDYQLIIPEVKTPDPDKVFVTEVFWYGCPHCFRFEPYIEQWADNLPDTVVFEQLPSALSQNWVNHARTFYSLQVMGEQKRLHRRFFDAIHVKRQRLNELDGIARFFARQGIDEAEFRQFFNSFAVETLLRKNQQRERKYGIDGVPAIIVNGKYRTSVSMAGGNERLIRVINFLIAEELKHD